MSDRPCEVGGGAGVGRRRMTTTDEETGETTAPWPVSWSKQELAFPPLREKGIPPPAVAVTGGPEPAETKGGEEKGRGKGGALPPLKKQKTKEKKKKMKKKKAEVFCSHQNVSLNSSV